MTPLEETRSRLTDARAAYLKDMLWLRRRYGIIAEPEPHLLKAALQASLTALEQNDLPSLRQALQSFDNLHKHILAKVTWDLLEQTKGSLKALRETEPELFEAKLRLWNKASWAFTTARFRQVTHKYREAIRTVAQI
jgi:hypothetical protein